LYRSLKYGEKDIDKNSMLARLLIYILDCPIMMKIVGKLICLPAWKLRCGSELAFMILIH